MSAVIERPNRASIARAVERLRAGELIAFPTETVYGLGADALRADAVRKIFAAKGRPVDHPVIVHLYGTAQLAKWARAVPDGARKLAAAFWPGPLTLILPRASHVADCGHWRPGQHRRSCAVASGRARAPRRIRQRNRGPVGQSLRANFADDRAARCRRSRRRRVDDPRRRSRARSASRSTIVGFTDGAPLCSAPAQSVLPILSACSDGVRAPASASPRAPGMLAAHYAPKTPATLVHRARCTPSSSSSRNATKWSLCSRAPSRGLAISPIRGSTRRSTLRAMRTTSTQTCVRSTARAPTRSLSRPCPPGDEWLAIRDRLERATRGEDDDRD